MHLACRQGGNREFLETFWMDLPPFIIDASMLFSQTGRMRAIKSDREELNAFCNPADGGSPLDDLAVDPYHWQPFEQDPRPQYLTQPTDRAIYEDWVFLSFPLLTFVKNDTSFSLSGLCHCVADMISIPLFHAVSLKSKYINLQKSYTSKLEQQSW